MSTRHDQQRLAQLLVIGKDLGSTTRLDHLLHKTVAATANLTNSREAAIFLIETNTGELLHCATTARAGNVAAGTLARVKARLAASVLRSREPLILPNPPPVCPRTAQALTSETQSLLAVPLQFGNRCIGILAAINSRESSGFSQNDVDLLDGLATHVAAAIENARLTSTLGQQREQIRDLASKLAQAEDAERRRLAQALHDLVGQDLTMLRLNLTTARQQVVAPTAGQASPRLDDSLALVDQIAKRLRDVTTGLQPPMLAQRGLLATLEWYGTQVASLVDINITVEGKDPIPRLSERTETALFCFAQEALAEVATQSAASSRATVALETIDDLVRLTISNDHLAPTMHKVEWGARQRRTLIDAAARVEALGGRTIIEPQPQQGTQLVVEVPR